MWILRRTWAQDHCLPQARERPGQEGRGHWQEGLPRRVRCRLLSYRVFCFSFLLYLLHSDMESRRQLMKEESIVKLKNKEKNLTLHFY